MLQIGDFVDEVPASIAGNVSRDDDNDGAGDRNLEGITVTLDDGAGNVLTTTTDNSGNYIFEDITPGNYTITQTNDPNFVDVNDAQGANNDSQIAVSVGVGETVTAQNFVDEIPASVAGNVSRDDDNDNAGERNLAGIDVNLIDIAGVTVATQTTDINGNYQFEDVTPGDYTIVQENDTNFVDVRDTDSTNDSRISVNVGVGESVSAQNFIDEVPASIAGNVSRDNDNDGEGDRNLEGITLTLDDGVDNTNNPTTTTDIDGNYRFEDVTPGDYTIVQENDTNFVDVDDIDNTNDSQIAVTVGIGENVTAQNFVDEIPASIAGNVSRDDDNDDVGDLDLSGITVNLIDTNGNTISTNTDLNGNYQFEDVTPGNYTIVQENAPNFADVADAQGANDSEIAVSVEIGESVVAQDFVDEVPASVSGNVSRDDDNNGTGDRNLAGISVNLIDSSNNLFAVQTTNSNGDYLFEDVTPGSYTIVQENDTNFVDVGDTDSTNDSQISVEVGVGQSVTDRNFIDEIPASIAGNVSRDDDNNGTGDRNLEGITVTLDDGAGNVLTTTTDNSGNYIFEDITPGNYTITQTNDPNFVDVNDAQGANNDSQIAVSVGVGETVTAQNFVDEIPASVAGNVSRDDDNDNAGERNLAGIDVNLIDIAGVTVATQTTDINGNYQFEDVTPGDYTIVQENDTNFVDVRDTDSTNDSRISVNVGVGETVTAQDFVDEIPASIAGNVSRDDDNDGAGNRSLKDITVTLDDGAGNVLTTTTDNSGNYKFEDVTPGNYTIVQANETDFVDVSDVEGANNSQIELTVGIGQSVTDRDFVDEIPASIAGNVSRDDDNDDGEGDRNLSRYYRQSARFRMAGTVSTTTQTLTNGNYLFEDVTPGNYTIVQENDTDFARCWLILTGA